MQISFNFETTNSFISASDRRRFASVHLIGMSGRIGGSGKPCNRTCLIVLLGPLEWGWRGD
jgi:hypothetical protein